MGYIEIILVTLSVTVSTIIAIYKRNNTNFSIIYQEPTTSWREYLTGNK